MKLVLTAITEDGTITLEQNEVDYLPDYAETLFRFTNAIGYTYVKKVVMVKDDNSEATSY